MVKIKTHKSTQKRIKVTKTGKLRRRNAYRSHLLEKKAPKRKEKYTKEKEISSADKKKVKKLIPMYRRKRG